MPAEVFRSVTLERVSRSITRVRLEACDAARRSADCRPSRASHCGVLDFSSGRESTFSPEPCGADCIPEGVSPCGLAAGAPPDLVLIGPVGPCGDAWPRVSDGLFCAGTVFCAINGPCADTVRGIAMMMAPAATTASRDVTATERASEPAEVFGALRSRSIGELPKMAAVRTGNRLADARTNQCAATALVPHPAPQGR